MATNDVDVKHQTAESFAREYIDDLLNNNKNLGTFEEETLDITIKSKYDNLDIEEEDNKNKYFDEVASQPNHLANKTPLEVEANGQKELNENGAIEPGHNNLSQHSTENKVIEPDQTELVQKHENEVINSNETEPVQQSEIEPNQINLIQQTDAPNHNEDESVHVANTDVKLTEVVHQTASSELEPNQTELVHEPEITVAEVNSLPSENNVVEPGQNEFAQSNDVVHTTIEPGQSEIAPQATDAGSVEEPQQNGTQLGIKEEDEEECEEKDDVVAPIPISRNTVDKNDEEEIARARIGKLGLGRNWWASMQASENDKEAAPPVDKFRTIKQNIRKGNTRSLKERFEQFSKGN